MLQVTFLLLGVENIGIQIEQPFSVLPLELFCATARANVIEQLKVRRFRSERRKLKENTKTLAGCV